MTCRDSAAVLPPQALWMTKNPPAKPMGFKFTIVCPVNNRRLFVPANNEIIRQRMAGMQRDERVLQLRSAVSDDERRYRLHDEE